MCIENRKARSHHFDHQGGFVLVMSLVLLAVLTLIGVSSMNSANMELRAAANAQHHQIAFNAVQSVLEYAVSDGGASNFDFQTNDGVPQVLNYTALADASALSASAVYADCADGDGNSVEDDKAFSFNYFEITGSGANKAGTATSEQIQGIRFPAASCKEPE